MPCRRGERERALLNALKKARAKHGDALGSRLVPLDPSKVGLLGSGFRGLGRMRACCAET